MRSSCGCHSVGDDYLANCVVAGEANVGRARRMRPKAKPRQMNATANIATNPVDDAHAP